MKNIVLLYLGLFNVTLISFVKAQGLPIKEIASSEKYVHIRNQLKATAVLPNNYDLKYSRMSWNVDPAIKFISGSVYYLFYHSDTIHEFKLEMSDSLVTDSIIMQGNSLAYTHSNGILTADLGQYLNPNQYDSIRVYYHGIPPETGFGSFAAEVHGPDSVPVMWTLSEPYGSKDWWPSKQDLNDKIDSIDIYIKAPLQYKAASNGILIGETIVAPYKVTHWKHKYPIPSYLVAFALTDYTVFINQASLTSGVLDVVNYIYPEDSIAAQIGVGELITNLVFMDSLFTPYPFMNEKYGHAQFNWGGGMEHQTMSFVGNFSYELLAHELAHQWFGDLITCGSWQELWLNEGFATYLTGLCYERFSPQLYWKIWKANQVDFITSSPDGSVLVTDTMDIPRLFDARLTYSKGAMFLHMLRWKLGDDVFFNALRNYLNNPLLAYHYARNIDLKTEFETESGENLDAFFNDWYSGEGYPSYQLSYDQDTNNLISFSLSQSQSHPSVSFYEMPVPILFKNALQDTLMVFDHLFSGQSFTAQPGFKVDSVIIDPEHWIVCKDNVVTSIKESLTDSKPFKLHPNPANEVIYIQGIENINIPHHIEIINTAGAKIFETNTGVLNEKGLMPLDIAFLTPGIYQIRIVSSKNNFNLVFVKH